LGNPCSEDLALSTAAVSESTLWQPLCKLPGFFLQVPLGKKKLVLEKIFSQFCNLSLAPVTMVFVFDGPGRPSVKRGTRVLSRPLWLIEHLKKMITHFGFYFYEASSKSSLRHLISDLMQAPGEAKAELGQLNDLGKIDGILTEDSDTLFGARLVIRTLGYSYYRPGS
jgi:hypothetical protein